MTDRYQEARRLLAGGIKLCELYPNSKQPKGDDWNHRLLTDPSQVRPDAGGYGIPLVANNLCSVDFDNAPVAERGLRAVGLDPDWLRGCGVSTSSTRPGSGGRAAFKVPAGRTLKWVRFTNKTDGTILELRATSPNLQDCMPGTTYSSADGSGPWVQDYDGLFLFDDAPEPPEALIDWWENMSISLEFRHAQQKIIAGEAAVLDVSNGTHLAFGSAHRLTFNMANDVEEILLRHGYDEKNRRYAPPTATGGHGVRRIPGRDDLWQSDHASDPLFGTFDAWTAHVSLDHDQNLAAAEAAAETSRELVAVEGFSDMPVVLRDEAAELRELFGEDVVFDDAGDVPAFERDKNGKIKAIVNNTLAAVRHSGVCGVRLGMDTFRDEIMLAPAGTEQWRPFRDGDYTRIRATLEKGANGFLPIGKELIRDSVRAVSEDNAFDSAVMWLERLRWDGVSRVETFLTEFFSAADTPYSRAVSRYLWTAMAGRVLVPGIKADMVPILVGDQGVGKSTSIAAMVPDMDFFTEVSFAESEDNLSRKMRGKLIGEIAELKGLASRDMETVKAFVTRTHEKWVPKYQEFETTFPRRLVFIGTTNKDQFLADETGNRRWLPLRVGTVNVTKIAQFAEQLWAEAAIIFAKNGVEWQSAKELAVAEHEQFSYHDEWEYLVSNWLVKGVSEAENPADGLLTSDILRLAVGLGGWQAKRSDEMRCAAVMRKLGFNKRRVTVNKTQTWRWLPTSEAKCQPNLEVGNPEILF